MKQKIGLLGAIIVVLLVGGLGAGYFFHWRYIESTDNAYIEADISVISAKITGYVNQIHVQENQKVHLGEELLTLTPVEYQAKLQKARSSLELVKATLANVAARLALQESSIIEAQAEVEKLTTDIDLFKKSYDRALNLNRHDFASKKMLETAQADFLKARSSLKKAEANLAAQKQQIVVLETEREQNQAKLLGAQADTDLAQQDVDNTHIIAPLEGSVGNKLVQQGQLVRPGQYLMSVVPETCYVFANFKETQLKRMMPGLKATLSIDAFPDEIFYGTIESLSPASGAVFSLLPPENATGNFTKIVQRIPVKIIFEDAGSAKKTQAWNVGGGQGRYPKACFVNDHF